MTDIGRFGRILFTRGESFVVTLPPFELGRVVKLI